MEFEAHFHLEIGPFSRRFFFLGQGVVSPLSLYVHSFSVLHDMNCGGMAASDHRISEEMLLWLWIKTDQFYQIEEG